MGASSTAPYPFSGAVTRNCHVPPAGRLNAVIRQPVPERRSLRRVNAAVASASLRTLTHVFIVILKGL